VATHLARHLHAGGHRIGWVWSRNLKKAEALALETGGRATGDLEEVGTGSDFYLLAVPDSAIVPVATKFKGAPGIWMHTAGAVPLSNLAPLFERSGVLYPLQTLTRERNLSLSATPVLTEGSDPHTATEIHRLASSISTRVTEADSDQRLVIHLAAVFANNFTNHMVAVAREILADRGLDQTLLDPLLDETWAKFRAMGARQAQTGPALRGDRETMEKHLELLKVEPGWQKIYTFISQNIRHE